MNRKAYPSDLSDAQWNLLQKHFHFPRMGVAADRAAIRCVKGSMCCFIRLAPAALIGLCPMSFHHGLWCGITFIPGVTTEHSNTSTALCALRIATCLGAMPPRVRRFLIAKASRSQKRGPKGFDAGKKVNGRKRHLLVDTVVSDILCKRLLCTVAFSNELQHPVTE